MTMRALIPFVLFTPSLFAQSCPSGLTAIQDTVYAPGSPAGAARFFQGTVTIRPSQDFISASGVTYGAVPYVATVGTTGAISVCLAPNDTAVPSGTSYLVRYQHTDAQGSAVWNEVWVVPTSSSPVTIAAIRTTAVPTPGMTVNLSELQPPLTASAPLQLNAATGVISCSTCGSSNVASVFGRTGAVTAQSGDYTAALVTNALDLSVSRSANVVLAGPSSGSAAAPTFRALVLADLPSLTSTIYGALSAASPLSFNSGTGQFSCASCLTSNAVSSVFGRTGAVTAQSGDYTASQVTNALDLSVTRAANTVLAGPSSGSAAAPAFRALVLADLPSLTGTIYGALSAASPLSFNSGTGQFSCASCLTSNAVTSVFGRTGAVTAQSGDYTAAQVTNALDLSVTRAANTVLAGPSSGSAAAPTFRALVLADLPSLTSTIYGALSAASPLVFNSGTGQFSCASCLTSNGIPSTTDLLQGNGSGNASDSGIAPGNVVTASSTLTSLGALVGGGSKTVQVSSQFTVASLGTYAEQWTLVNTGLGTTPTGGIELNNTTAAASGAQQASGPFTMCGNGWKTTSTAASQSVCWQAYTLPVQGTTAPSGEWILNLLVNGSAANETLVVTSSGVYVPDGIVNSTAVGLTSNGTNNGGLVSNSSAQFGWNNSGQAGVKSSGELGFFSNTTVTSGTLDAYLTRYGPGLMLSNGGIGCGGTKFTVSGLSSGSTVGGSCAGTFTLGANGPGTVTVTLNGATGLTAPSGWHCSASDETSQVLLVMSGHTTTTASFAVPSSAMNGDVINWGCSSAF